MVQPRQVSGVPSSCVLLTSKPFSCSQDLQFEPEREDEAGEGAVGAGHARA